MKPRRNLTRAQARVLRRLAGSCNGWAPVLTLGTTWALLRRLRSRRMVRVGLHPTYRCAVIAQITAAGRKAVPA